MKALKSRKGLYRLIIIISSISLSLLAASCSYRHYMGLHGPSIKQQPAAHADFTADKSCLTCHSKGSSVAAPKSQHPPEYKECLKCHKASLARENSVHASFTSDRSCRLCHGPGTNVAPATNHANFKGCLKCHNDEPSRGALDNPGKSVNNVSIRDNG